MLQLVLPREALLTSPPLHGHVDNVKGEMARQCHAAKLLLLEAPLYSWAGPAFGSKRYAVPTQHFGCHRHSRRFRRHWWATVARRSSFATDQQRLED